MVQTTLESVGGSPTSKREEIAGIVIAPDTLQGFVGGLLLRAEQNHEHGLRGRCPQ